MEKLSIKKIKKGFLYIILFMIFCSAFLITFYFFSPLGKFNQRFFKIIPYPITLIDGNQLITTRDLLQNVESLEKFYNSQDFSEIGLRIDFETKEGQQRLKVKEKEIFNKLIEDKIIQSIARAEGINVSKKEAGQELISKAQEAGNTENLALNLKKLYNWSLSDFRDKVIIPRIYLIRLIDYYEKEIDKTNSSKSKINQAYQSLTDNNNFEEVAKKYSEGETAENGGSIGWFKKEYLSKKIAEKAYSMQPGEFSEVIKSSLGSHIIYLEEIKEKNNVKEVKLKQIFTQEGSFLNWLNTRKKEYSIRTFLKDYYWDKKELKIKFSNQLLEENETILRSNSNGDPSVY